MVDARSALATGSVCRVWIACAEHIGHPFRLVTDALNASDTVTARTAEHEDAHLKMRPTTGKTGRGDSSVEDFVCVVSLD